MLNHLSEAVGDSEVNPPQAALVICGHARPKKGTGSKERKRCSSENRLFLKNETRCVRAPVNADGTGFYRSLVYRYRVGRGSRSGPDAD